MIIKQKQELAYQIELADALNQVEFVKAHKKNYKNSIADFIKIGSGYAVFAGVDSPITQAFALGFKGTTGESNIFDLEEFFFSRKSPVNIEVSQMSDFKLTELLIERDYKLVEYSNVLLLDLQNIPRQKVLNNFEIRIVNKNEINEACKIVELGFSEGIELPESFSEAFKTFTYMENNNFYIAFADNKIVGGGSLFESNGMVFLGGASTLKEFRGRGIQSELIKARLNKAKELNYKYAVIVTQPGTISEHNALKFGFKIEYARNKFMKTK